MNRRPNQDGQSGSLPRIRTEANAVPHANGAGHRSEVVAFLEQWDLEIAAMKQGLQGMAITARHEFIITRMSGGIDEQRVEALHAAMRQEQKSASPAD